MATYENSPLYQDYLKSLVPVSDSYDPTGMLLSGYTPTASYRDYLNFLASKVGYGSNAEDGGYGVANGVNPVYSNPKQTWAEAIDAYNNGSDAIDAKHLFTLNGMLNKFASDPNQQMTQGSKWLNTKDGAADRFLQAYQADDANNRASGGIGGFLAENGWVVPLAMAGGAYAGLGEGAAAGSGEGFIDTIGAIDGAGAGLGGMPITGSITPGLALDAGSATDPWGDFLPTDPGDPWGSLTNTIDGPIGGMNVYPGTLEEQLAETAAREAAVDAGLGSVAAPSLLDKLTTAKALGKLGPALATVLANAAAGTLAGDVPVSTASYKPSSSGVGRASGGTGGDVKQDYANALAAQLLNTPAIAQLQAPVYEKEPLPATAQLPTSISNADIFNQAGSTWNQQLASQLRGR